jgi:hypothetical protein
MEALELDTALEELEIRLERLRALYEQYFLGIEKIEPAVARKDVDRRIYVLRREKIRNTAKRFKLQTIIQRYNTFQQYWQRICREIENGTYKRHMLRAERTFGTQLMTIAAKKRLGAFSRISKPPEARASEPAPAPSEPPPSPEAAPAAAAAPVSVGSGPKRVRLQTGDGKLAAQPSAYESLDLDMDFLGDWDPSRAAAKGRKGQPKPPPQPQTGSIKPVPIKAITSRPPPAAPAPAAPARPPPAPTLVGIGRLQPPPKPERRKTPSRPMAVPPPKPAKPVSKPEAAPPPALSDERVRELHSRLVEAKRQTKDTGNVSLEGLAKSLKATEERLREQHKNRRIDFDVIIKDGKAVVKPIVR